MALRIILLFLLALFSAEALAADTACEQSSRSDDERFTELSAVSYGFNYAEGSFDDLAEENLERFRSLWCDSEYGNGLGQADDAAVSLRLRAARKAAFYARSDWVLERLRAVVEEAYARGLADSEELTELFTAFQVAGRYETARELRAMFPGVALPEVPQVVAPTEEAPSGGRQVWHVDGEANRLRGDWLSLQQSRLLIVTSPGCGFCKAAAEELLADEVLAPLMRAHASWLAERSMNATFRSVAHWNEHYPAAPTMLVENPGDWPISDFSSTPQFHFVRDGEVIHTLAGWRGGPEALQAVAEGFGRLGLLDASQLADDVFAYADKPSYTRGCPERQEAHQRIRERAPISTRNDLDRHLAEIETGADSPLTNFSIEGRKRFVSSMRFSDDGGLMGFSYGELKAQLEPKEIYDVTGLFGRQYFYAGKLFEPELLSEEERELKTMLDCEA